MKPGLSLPSKRAGPYFRPASQTVPLLESYGAVPKPGSNMAKFPPGENAGVIIVEYGDKTVYITDLKGAKEMMNESGGTKRSPGLGPQGSYQESYRDDTLALIMSDDDQNPNSSSGYVIKPVPEGNGSGRPSKEHSILQEFLSRIQNLPIEEPNATKKFWRERFPLILTGTLLLLTLLMTFVWILKFRDGFELDTSYPFNYHPTFMIMGFLVFSGFSMLFYRSLPCYDKFTVKLLHTAFHLFAIVCIAIGLTSVQASLETGFPDKPNPGFSSLHSWLGLATMTLFFLQFAFGFGSYLLAYFMCETKSSSWRAGLLPFHTTWGVVIFVMAAATSLTGLTEKAVYTLQDAYILGESEEVAYVGTLGLLITITAVVFVFTLRDGRMKRTNQPNVYNIQSFN